MGVLTKLLTFVSIVSLCADLVYQALLCTTEKLGMGLGMRPLVSL